jgi:chromosome segregation ATPase
VLLLVTQLDFNLTQLKERVEETASNIQHAVKQLEELKDLISDLRNDAGKTNDINQRCRQERGILKRAKEERDDEYQLLGCTQRKGKRARVTWDDQ